MFHLRSTLADTGLLLLAFFFGLIVHSQAQTALTYDDGAKSLCFQHLGQTDQTIAERSGNENSQISGKQCSDLPPRAKTCNKGGLWRDNPFLADGTCPAWFVQTYNWTQSDFGKSPGWHFKAEPQQPNAPLLMTITNNASLSSEPCVHHEVNFNYNFASMSFVEKEGRGPLFKDFKNIQFSYEARLVNASPSKCGKLPRALVKLSLVLRWYDKKNNANGIRRSSWQSSIAVILYDGSDMLAQLGNKPRENDNDNSIVFDNKCTIHRVWKSGTCMITLDGAALSLPRLNNAMTPYSVSLTQLLRNYADRLSPPQGQSLDDAEIKSVQVISAVNGADLTFQLVNPRLIGAD